LVISAFALGLSTEQALAQFVCGVSAKGLEAQTGEGAASNGANSLSCGMDAGVNAFGTANTAFGAHALNDFNGSNNTAVGAGAGPVGDVNFPPNISNTVAVGANARVTTDGGVAVGSSATAIGTDSVAIGRSAGAAGAADTSGNFQNTAVGTLAGADVSGSNNSALGGAAGRFVSGGGNSAFGFFAGRVVTGSTNAAFGLNAG
jgi:hypothetical protein